MSVLTPYVFNKRNVSVFLPPGKGPFPVVLNLHGGGSNSTQIAAQSEMNLNATRNGYAVIYPNGTGGSILTNLLKEYTWNAGLCCGLAMKSGVDDIGYLKQLVADLPNHFAVDKTRIYVTGMSNGAMMAYRLAVEAPELFAAIGAVSTTMGMDVVAPHLPVPIIEIHGLLDPNAPFNGGIGPNAQPQPGGPPVHHAVSNTIAQWAPINGYGHTPSSQNETGTYIQSTYTGTKAPFVLYALKEGGHTWPGGYDLTAKLGTGKLIASFNANEYMWQFFSKFTR